MKVKIKRTSDWSIKPKIKEFKDMTQAVAYCLDLHDRIIIERANDFDKDEINDLDYVIELYDDWRE